MESGWKNDVSDLSIENDENGDGATKPELADDRMIHPKTISNTSNVVVDRLTTITTKYIDYRYQYRICIGG